MIRRFVVQRHTVSPGEVHYDLMIEDGEVLVTFQLQAPPDRAVTGRRSFDHRTRYLTYEGEISGGRGRVEIWDRGRVEDLSGDPRATVYRGRFDGERLLGVYELSGEPGQGRPVRLGPLAERA